LMREINKSSKHLYFRCGNCGFYTARNFDNSSPYADYSDYKVGDDSFTKDWSARVQEAMRIVSKKFSITNLKSGNFLDIGCSEGFYVEAAQKLGWNAFGVEVAGPRVNFAQQKGLKISTFEDYKQKLNFFDFILIRHVIEHVPDFLGVIDSARNQLKEGGVVCIETPNQAGLISLIKRKTLYNDRFLGHLYPPTHIHAFEPRTYRAIGEKSNMMPLAIKTYSPADPDWFFQSNYHESLIKKIVHKALTKFGFGENVCVFFQKIN